MNASDAGKLGTGRRAAPNNVVAVDATMGETAKETEDMTVVGMTEGMTEDMTDQENATLTVVMTVVGMTGDTTGDMTEDMTVDPTTATEDMTEDMIVREDTMTVVTQTAADTIEELITTEPLTDIMKEKGRGLMTVGEVIVTIVVVVTATTEEGLKEEEATVMIPMQSAWIGAPFPLVEKKIVPSPQTYLVKSNRLRTLE